MATGGCQCGALRYAFYAPLQRAHVCHCRMCQRATGGLFAALAGNTRDNFAWTRGEPNYFASSNLAKREFCGLCGTPLTFQYLDPAARIHVTIGSLDHPELVKLEMQYGIESRLPWVKFCEEVPAEVTAATAENQAYLAGLTPNQRGD